MPFLRLRMLSLFGRRTSIMEILKYKSLFLADHSSTSYLFYSSKNLTKTEKAVVSRLSSHVDVGSKTAEITYNSEYADLDDDRRLKFLEYYDVEVRESYDWWLMSIVLEKSNIANVKIEGCEGEEVDLYFEDSGDKVILNFEGCHLDYSACFEKFGENLMDELAEFLIEIREELYKEITDTIKVMKYYCEEDSILSSKGLSKCARILCSILEPLG